MIFQTLEALTSEALAKPCSVCKQKGGYRDVIGRMSSLCASGTYHSAMAVELWKSVSPEPGSGGLCRRESSFSIVSWG